MTKWIQCADSLRSFTLKRIMQDDPERFEVGKIDAAGYQLDAAIRLIINDNDYLAASVLCYSGWNIIKDILNGREIESTTAFLPHILPVSEDRAWLWLKKRWNFLKHADKDPDSVCDFSPDFIAGLVSMAIEDFKKVTNRVSPNMVHYIHVDCAFCQS